MLTASAWVPGLTPGAEDGPAKWWQGAFLFGALYIVALGTGGMCKKPPHLTLPALRPHPGACREIPMLFFPPTLNCHLRKMGLWSVRRTERFKAVAF